MTNTSLSPGDIIEVTTDRLAYGGEAIDRGRLGLGAQPGPRVPRGGPADDLEGEGLGERAARLERDRDGPSRSRDCSLCLLDRASDGQGSDHGEVVGPQPEGNEGKGEKLEASHRRYGLARASPHRANFSGRFRTWPLALLLS